MSFGWGDENFYLNTPTWNDLTFRNAFSALFLDSNTLIHLTKHSRMNSEWTIVNLNEKQLLKLNKYILNSFQLDKKGRVKRFLGQPRLTVFKTKFSASDKINDLSALEIDSKAGITQITSATLSADKQYIYI